MPALLSVKGTLQRLVFGRLAQVSGSALENGHLVRLAEEGSEEDFAHDGAGSAHPQDVAPAQRLGHGAADCWTDGAPDQGGEHNEGHSRAALLRDVDVADDGWVQHIAGDREAGQEAREDEELSGLGEGTENDAENKEDVGDVENRVAAIELGEGSHEQRPGCFAELPHSDEEDRGRLVSAAREIEHDPIGDGDDAYTCEGSEGESAFELLFAWVLTL